MTTPKPLASLAAIHPLSVVQSPLGKKILTGLTGLGLASFVLIHMLGNLLLLWGRDRFNQYGHLIEQLKPLVIFIEGGLLLLVAVHAGLGLQIFLRRRQARPLAYQQYKSAGDPSHQTWSSRNMIWTGGSLALFLIWHLKTFKFGPIYTTTLQGQFIRDLSQLVIETFQQPEYFLGYALILGVLLLHLRHGLWSALQSLGLVFPNHSPKLYWVCNGVAFLLFLGFMLPPISIFWGQIR